MRIGVVLATLLALTLSRTASAQPFAQPPDDVRYRTVHVAEDWRSYDGWDDGWRRRELSIFRVHVGAAGRALTDSFTPGLMTAIDLGRGPAGFRASAMWLRVGSDDGLAQYAGELTLDLGGRSVWRPVLGAGAGLARTSRVDEHGAHVSGGASLLIGVMRGGIEYRLPIEGTDSRAGLCLMGVLPAARGGGAPDLKGWAMLTASVGIGF